MKYISEEKVINRKTFRELPLGAFFRFEDNFLNSICIKVDNEALKGEEICSVFCLKDSTIYIIRAYIEQKVIEFEQQDKIIFKEI